MRFSIKALPILAGEQNIEDYQTTEKGNKRKKKDTIEMSKRGVIDCVPLVQETFHCNLKLRKFVGIPTEVRK